jgi:hypothetical protein
MRRAPDLTTNSAAMSLQHPLPDPLPNQSPAAQHVGHRAAGCVVGFSIHRIRALLRRCTSSRRAVRLLFRDAALLLEEGHKCLRRFLVLAVQYIVYIIVHNYLRTKLVTNSLFLGISRYRYSFKSAIRQARQYIDQGIWAYVFEK